MYGVFLHVLADTLGSVGVIISCYLIKYYGLLIADPICSGIISILILLSLFPLLRSTSSVLLMRTPRDFRKNLKIILKKVKRF
jgi:zinc transporter 5/7